MAKKSRPKIRRAKDRVKAPASPVAPEVIFADLQGSLVRIGPESRSTAVTGSMPSFLGRLRERIGARS